MIRSIPRERWIERLFFTLAAGGAVVTTGLVLVLLQGTLAFLGEVPTSSLVMDRVWSPTFADPRYGIVALLVGTLLVTTIAGLIALPLGLVAALYLDRVAGPRRRRALRSTLSTLAGVPTVAYGYFALTFVSPRLREVFPGTPVFTAAAAGVVVAIMILPLLVTLIHDALEAVADDISDAALALGATRTETALRAVLPAAAPGVLAACGLALSRALGETMIVTLAAGAAARVTLDPLEPVLTLTAFMVQVSLGDTPEGTVAYHSLYAVAAVLFLLTVGLNLLSRRLRAGRAA